MSDEKEPVKAKWVVTVGGGDWGTVKYGIVEYLRKHPRMRAATAIVGLLWVIGWLASMGGFKWHVLYLPMMSTFFVTPTLLWLAVVSGPDFSLTFQEKKPDAPPPALPLPESKGVLDPEGYGIEALNRSFDSAECYGRSSFRWAMFALLAGIAFGGTAMFLSHGLFKIRDEYVQQIAALLAGTMFLICALLLLRAMFVFRRASTIHDKLLEMQKVITAIRFLERSKEASSVSVDPSFVVTKLLTPAKGVAGE
jgi:hypothetical protein